MSNPDSSTVTVTVVRTGGFAGLRREWQAHPPHEETERWVALIRECPWEEADAATPAPTGADRFTWQIEAHLGAHEHQVSLPETRLEGAWRALVDEVRAFAA